MSAPTPPPHVVEGSVPGVAEDLARIASRLVTAAADELDGAIALALAEVGPLAGASRACVFVFDASREHVRCIDEWCAPGVSASNDRRQGVPVAAFPHGLEGPLGGEELYVPRVSGLPAGFEAERAQWEGDGIQTLLTLPLRVDGHAVGVLGFDWVEAPSDVTPGTLELLRLLSEVLSGAVERRRAAAQRARHGRFVRAMNRAAQRFAIVSSSGLQEALLQGIGEVAEVLDFDHAYLVDLLPGAMASVRLVWRRDGEAPLVEAGFEARVPWVVATLAAGEPIIARDTSHLPPDAHEEREVLAALSFEELVDVPMFDGVGALAGWLGFATTRAGRRIEREDATLIEVLARLVAQVDVRGKAEAKVRESEERFRSLVAATEEAFYTFEYVPPIDTTAPVADQVAALEGGRLVACNASYARLMGAERPEDVLGKTAGRIHAPEAAALGLAAMARFVSQGYRLADEELRGAGSDDERVMLHQTFGVVEGSRLARSWGLLRDITDRARREQEAKAVEARLIHAGRLESVGRLAGGVAHDFNNQLVDILRGIELARDALRAAPTLSPEIERAEARLTDAFDAAHRSAGLTQELLDFARRRPCFPVVASVDTVVGEAAQLVRRVLPTYVRLDLRLSAQGVCCALDPDAFERVLVHLASNARDAIVELLGADPPPAGPRGCVTLTTELVKGTASLVMSHPGLRPVPHVRVAMRDDGVGITPEARARMFEPFFTTKARGEASGLGLATVFGLVHRLGGIVVSEERPGPGATFAIYLPAVEGAQAASAQDEERSPASEPVHVLGADPMLRRLV